MEHLREITFLNILFYVANFLWLLEFIVFRNRSQKGTFQEKRSFYMLVILIILTIVGSIFFSRERWGLLRDESIYPVFQIVGIIFYSGGLTLRYTGSSRLGKYFTRHVNVESSMEFVSHGPYRYFRHPLYLGLFLLVIAFPIFIGNALAFLIFSPLIFLALNARMTLEERALEVQHPSYKEWKKSRYRFFPFIY